jgi:hypothetical protein
MAVVQMKASDLTGEKGEAEEFGRLFVRRHQPSGGRWSWT